MDLLARSLWRYRRQILPGLLFLLLTNVTSLLAPWVLKYAIDDLKGGVVSGKLLLYAGLILTVALLQGLFRFIMRRILIGVSRFVEYDLRLAIYDHLLLLPPEFYQANRTGDIISRSTSDLENVRLFIGPGLMNLCSTLVLFLTALGFMLSMSPALTAAALLPLPAAAVLMAFFSTLYHRAYKRTQEANATLASHAQENFAGIRVVKSYRQEEPQIEEYRRLNESYRERSMKLAKMQGFFHPVVGFIMGLSTIIVLWIGGRMIIAGRMTLGQLVAFLGMVALLIWPTIALGWVISLFQRGRASAERIAWILDTVPAIHEPAEPVTPETIRGEIAIRNLTFTYPGAPRPSLQDVSLEISAGQRVAFVGRTGSGKTTLAALIPRLWNVADGCIFIDGIDINRLPLTVLRKAIGFVPQEAFLFSDTIERNILLGTPEGSLDVAEAARLAGIRPEIDGFPAGFATQLGERGITLSGGQRQRTALARALVRDPRILVLDDAFSSVDTQTERLVRDNLVAVMPGRTVILVTHRLTAVTDADLIIVMDGGRVAERGTHAELMALDGLYAGMFRRQTIIEEIESGGDAA